MNHCLPKTPGPGAYSNIAAISPKGAQFVSQFESSKASNFNPPSSCRFKDFAQKIALFPGPAHYNQISTWSPNGSYYLAKYRSSMSRTFGNEIRPEVGIKGTFKSMLYLYLNIDSHAWTWDICATFRFWLFSESRPG